MDTRYAPGARCGYRKKTALRRAGCSVAASPRPCKRGNIAPRTRGRRLCTCADCRAHRNTIARKRHAVPEVATKRNARRAVGRSNNREKEIWRSAKTRARNQGLPFTIAPSDVRIPEFCPALGMRLSLCNDRRRDDSPSLDKIIPGRGYVPGNVEVISWKANRLKSDATHDELVKLARWAQNATARIIFSKQE